MLSNRPFPPVWEEALGAKPKHSPFPMNPTDFEMDTFRANQITHQRDYSPCRAEIPLDLTLLNKPVQIIERDTDSPLDLSLKTRKRCADTTDTGDDVIFIDQRYPAKRTCPDNGHTVTNGSTIKPKSEQTNGWPGATCVNVARKSPAYGPPYIYTGCHETSKRSFNPDYDPRITALSYSAQHSSVTHIPKQDPRGPQHIPLHNSRKYPSPMHDGITAFARQRELQTSGQKVNTYPSYESSPMNTSLNIATNTCNTSVHNGYHAPTHPRQLYNSKSCSTYHSPRNGTTHAQFSQGVSSSCVSMESSSLPNDTRSPSIVPFTGVVPHDPRVIVSMHNQSRTSELRAALSSRNRYFPRLTPMIPSPVTVSQRCSPDSTFPVTSAHVHKTVAPISSSPVVTVTSVSGLCGAEVTAKSQVTLSPQTKTEVNPPCSSAVAKSRTQSSVSKSNSDTEQICSLDRRTVASSKATDSTKTDNVASLFSNNEIPKPRFVANECTDSRYNTPLSISIPDKHTDMRGSSKREEIKPFSRNPKLTCKKHIILNAVNQDEDLKMLTIPSLTRSPPSSNSNPSSPSEQPPSPKMPILSPQHQIPLPLYSPLINEPPSLEPTSSSRGKNDNKLTVPDGSYGFGVRNNGGSASAVVVTPVQRFDDPSSRRAPESFASGDAPNLKEPISVIQENHQRIPKITNLSAFVQTPNGKISPVRLKSNPEWVTVIRNDNEQPYNGTDHSTRDSDIFGGSCKLTDWRSENRAKTYPKLIPIANVAPMVHRVLDQDTVNTNDLEDSKVSESKVVDLQAEIAAYKSSLRMPAKLMPKSCESNHGQEVKRSGIAEKFGASESRFKHINAGKELTNLRAIYGKLFGAKELSKCRKISDGSLPISESDDTDVNMEKKERNIWQSISDSSKIAEPPSVDTNKFISTDGDKECNKECDEAHAEEIQDQAASCPEQYPRLKKFKPIMNTIPLKFNCQRGTESPTNVKFSCSPNPHCSKERLIPEQSCCDDAECSGTGSSSSCIKLQKRHRRSMLDEIADSVGYVAGRKIEEKPPSVDLFADPALLSREERALQRAMMRFTEMESGGLKRPRKVQQKQQSSSRQRADQLKRKALRHSPQKKGARGRKHHLSLSKKGFVDFQPEVLESRTRMQSKGCHSVGGYNRDAAYENELKNDERRRELKRARRMAHQMAHRRAMARRIHREQKLEERKLKETPKQKEHRVSVSEGKERTIHVSSPRTSRLQKLRELSRDTKTEFDLNVEKPVSRDLKKKELIPNDVDELPDLVEEIKSVDTEGCWEVRNLASSDSLSQTLRSGRKKGGILMKLSWRPTTASSKGKPRIAHARVSSTKGRGSKTARMLQLRRRAKLAYFQATQKGNLTSVSKKSNINVSRNNMRVAKRPPITTRYPLRDLTPKKETMKKVKKVNVKKVNLRPKQVKVTQKKLSMTLQKEDVTPKKEDVIPVSQVLPEVDDGNTTEEYEFEDIVEEEEYRAYSDDDSVYDDALNLENDDIVFDDTGESLEPPELRKLSVNKNSGETLLHRAARLGYEDVVLYCLQSQTVDVNARDNAGYTALHECCAGGHILIARHLLSHGANPNCCSHDGVRPIQGPVENNNVDITRLLLSYGADQLVATMDHDLSPQMSTLLNGYLGDINGYMGYGSEDPWEFYGSAVVEEECGVDHNLLSSLPSDEEDEDVESLFQWSNDDPLVSYMVKVPEADSEDNYVILSHVLWKYEMTRAMFLREFGPTVRIYSLSRYALEDDIMHSSTIYLPMSLGVQSQTVELIRLDDLDIIETRKSTPGKGKQSLAKRRTGNNHKRVKRRIFDSFDDHEPITQSLDIVLETADQKKTRNDLLHLSLDVINKVDSDKNDHWLRSVFKRDERSLGSPKSRCAIRENTISVVKKEKLSEQSRAIPELLSSTDRLLTLNEPIELAYQHDKVAEDRVTQKCIRSVKDVCELELDLVNNNKKPAEIPLLDNTSTESLDYSERLLEIDR